MARRKTSAEFKRLAEQHVDKFNDMLEKEFLQKYERRDLPRLCKKYGLPSDKDFIDSYIEFGIFVNWDEDHPTTFSQKDKRNDYSTVNDIAKIYEAAYQKRRDRVNKEQKEKRDAERASGIKTVKRNGRAHLDIESCINFLRNQGVCIVETPEDAIQYLMNQEIDGKVVTSVIINTTKVIEDQLVFQR